MADKSKTYRIVNEFTAYGKTRTAMSRLYRQVDKSEVNPEDFLPFITFMAFSIKGYINHIGAKSFSYWDEMERLPWKAKLTILHKHTNIIPDWGSDPLQFATEIFGLRDKLAHGRAEKTFSPFFDNEDDARNYDDNNDMEPEWFKKRFNKEWSKKAWDRNTALLDYISDMCGRSKGEYNMLSIGYIETVG